MRVEIPKYIQPSYFSYNKCESKQPLNTYSSNIFQPTFKSSYTPVKNIKEARNYAAKHLNLNQYEIEDVEVANWLNKALIYVKNLTHGKSTILDKVVCADYKDPNGNSKKIMATYQCETFQFMSSTPRIINDTLIINKKFIKNINETLDVGKENLINLNILTQSSRGLHLANNYTTKYKKEFETLLNKRYRDMTFEDKMGLIDFLGSLSSYSEFKIADVGRYVNKFLAHNSPKIPFTDIALLKLGLNNVMQFSLLNKCEQMAGVKHNVNIDGKYKTILHEVGHMLHAHESPEIFLGMNQAVEKYFRNNLYTASKITQYAKTSPCEFVAETFVKMALKMKLPYDVTKMYKICGGYII